MKQELDTTAKAGPCERCGRVRWLHYLGLEWLCQFCRIGKAI